jgi:TonB family protein
MKTIKATLSIVLLMAATSFGTDSAAVEIEFETIPTGPTDDGNFANTDTVPQAPTDSLPELEKEPVLQKFVPITYPAALEKKAVEGTVRLDLLVSEKGTVDSVGIVTGLHPLIDSAVAAAAAQFRFDPAIAGNAAVPVIITYDYRVTFTVPPDRIAKTVNFSGVVLERGTRVPIAGAEVVVTFTDTSVDRSLPLPLSRYLTIIGTFGGQTTEGMSITTSTDSGGRFSFTSLPPGPLRVSIPIVGYEAFVAEEVVRPAEALDVVYRLQKVIYSEYEVVVYGKETPREVSRRTLSVSEIRKIPGFGGDAVKVVQALPGVARSSFGGGAVVVRGAPTWDSKFYLDGIPIPQLYHFGGVKSTYNSDALSGIDFYPGGFSSRFGGAIAGVIDLKGKQASTERAHGFGDASLLDATVFVESPAGKKVSLMGAARRSYIGDLLGFAVDNFPVIKLPVTVAPYYDDFLLRADVRPTRDQHAFVTLFGSKDKLELIVPFLRRGSSEIDSLADRVRQMQAFYMGIAGWDAKLRPGLENHLRTSVVYSEGYGSIFGFAKFNLYAWEYVVRDELSYSFNDRVKLNTGIDLWWERLVQHAQFPNPSDNTLLGINLTTDFGRVAPYADLELHPVPSLRITPGVRYDYYNELDYDGSLVPELWEYSSDRYRHGGPGEPSFRLSARYTLAGEHTVKASVGTYNQSPQPQGFATNATIGNPKLPATRARHIVAGYEHAFTDLDFLDVQLYHNQQWGIPLFASNADLLANPGGPRLLPDGKGRMYGLEVLLRHDNSERFFGWIAYTLARTERYNRAEKRYTLYDRDQTHNFQLVGSYRFAREWQAGTRIRYVSGNPLTPIVGNYFNMTDRFYVPVYGPENSERNDPFFQVDLRVDKKFVFDRWMFSAYLDVQNVLVFLYKSPEFTVYNYDYTEKTSISMPFIPSLGIRAEF